MRRCIIHIGLHKTASTSLQRMIGENRQLLAARGFYVPAVSTEEYSFGHHALSYEFSDMRLRREDAVLYAEFVRELEERDRPPNVLMSSEDFSRRIHNSMFLRRLRLWLAHLGYTVELVGYVRPQHTAIQAMYTQRLKMWGMNQTFEDFWPDILEGSSYDYHRRFRHLLRGKGMSAQLFPFNSEVFGEGIHHHFLRNIGVPLDALPALKVPDNRNVAPGPKTIAALLTIPNLLKAKGHHAERAEVDWMVRIIRHMAKSKGWDSERYNALTPEITATILERYRESNEAFAPRAFGRAWNDVFAAELAARPPVNVFHRELASAEEREEFDEFTRDAAEAISQSQERGILGLQATRLAS